MRTTVKRQVEELTTGRHRIARAYLAEAYDGIGQYVKLSMTKGGVTSALQGRVAAGDFGGGRTFPAGTPVAITSYRGQIEVFLGNIPNVCGSFDNFSDRDIPVGTEWGPPSSDPRYDWFTSGSTADLSVSDGYGNVESTGFGSSFEFLDAIYQGDNGSDADIRFRAGVRMLARFKFDDDIPDPDFLQIIFEVLQNTGSLRSRGVSLFLTADTSFDGSSLFVTDFGNSTSGQNEYVFSGLPRAGDMVNLKWEFIPGVIHQAKVWWDGAEPDWQASRIPAPTTVDTWCRFHVNTDQGYNTNWHIKCISLDRVDS